MEDPAKTNCETCHRRGETKRAAVICRECRIRFCSDCREDHAAYEDTKDHTMDEFTETFITTTEESSSDEELYGNDFEEEVFTKPYKTLDIKIGRDFTECQVRSICSLSADCVLVADSANRSLKVFDEKMTFCRSASIPEIFSCLDCIDDETVLTIWQKTLFYWRIESNQCLKIRDATLANVGYGVNTNGIIIAVIESSDSFVEFFDFDGNKTDSVDLASICDGKPGYAITLDSTDTRFYISNRDYDSGTKLLCVSFSGQLLWSCAISASVGGILEYDDHILAVSVGYARIHKVTREGRDAGVLAKDIGHLPFSICLQPLTKRIVVSHNNLGRDRNNLKIFDIL